MKNKSKLELIIIIAVLTFIVISFIIDIDLYVPGLTVFFPFIWVFFLVFDIFKSIQYLKNKPNNEIRLRSNNDSYYNVLPFIGGAIFCLISFLIFFQNETNITAILLFISGIILIFKGLIFVPSALIKIENGNLYFENGKVIDKFKIIDVENVILNEKNIEFKLFQNRKYIFSKLELNSNEIIKIDSFLKENIKS